MLRVHSTLELPLLSLYRHDCPEGGESYEKYMFDTSTVYAKRWDSSVEQTGSVVEFPPMPMSSTVWILNHADVFCYPTSSSPCARFPRHERVSLVEKAA